MKLNNLARRLVRRSALQIHRSRIQAVERQVSSLAPAPTGGPVLTLAPSAQLANVTFGGLIRQIVGWGLRLGGIPVHHLHCTGALYPCLLASTPEIGPAQPCAGCSAANARQLTPASDTIEIAMASELAGREGVSLDSTDIESATLNGWPVGRLCRPSLRWALRRHSLASDGPTNELFSAMASSAARFGDFIERQISNLSPSALLVFNGQFYPEAIAAEAARRADIPVVSYEAGYRELSAFFSFGPASKYLFDIPEEFHMDAAAEAAVDSLLARRRAGNVAMGRVRFWPEIAPLGSQLQQELKRFKRIVVVYTGVPYDTTQNNADTVFQDMFAWLRAVYEQAQRHSETAFVIRVHPDEARPAKRSREPVAKAIEPYTVSATNVFLVPPEERVSSYALMDMADICLVYGSTLGVEAAAAGLPVIVANKSRYMTEPFAYYPENPSEFESLLSSQIDCPAPPLERDALVASAKRYLSFTFYKGCLDFSNFLQDLPGSGHESMLARFDGIDLSPDRCQEISIIREAITANGRLHYPV